MSKSTPSTSTTVQSNPLGQAQMPYFTNMWGQAGTLAGWNGSGVGDPVGSQYLDQIQGVGQSNFNASYPYTANLVPGASNFVTNALYGNANPYLPASSQISGLSGLGTNASNTGQYFAGQINDAAASIPGQISPWTSGLSSLPGQYGGLTNAGYGTYGTMNNLGGFAAGAAPGALGQFGNLSSGALNVANPQEQALMRNSGMAIAGNPAFNSGLMGLASGQYIDPNTNPALAGTIKAATDPLVRQYQTATSPQTDSAFEGGGRYGSGSWANAQGQNQYALGGALANATSNIVNNAYNQGLNTTLGAGQALGGIYNTGSANQAQALNAAGQLGQSGYQLGGSLANMGYGNYNSLLGTAGNLYSGGAGALNSLGGTGLGGAANAYSTGGQLDLSALQQMMQGYGSAASTANAGYGTAANALAQGGNLANSGVLNLGGLAQMAPDLANYPLSQLSTAYNSIWAPIQNYAGIMGQPLGGNTTTQQTTPYYSNTASNIIGGALGVAKLASMI